MRPHLTNSDHEFRVSQLDPNTFILVSGGEVSLVGRQELLCFLEAFMNPGRGA